MGQVGHLGTCTTDDTRFLALEDDYRIEMEKVKATELEGFIDPVLDHSIVNLLLNPEDKESGKRRDHGAVGRQQGNLQSLVGACVGAAVGHQMALIVVDCAVLVVIVAAGFKEQAEIGCPGADARWFRRVDAVVVVSIEEYRRPLDIAIRESSRHIERGMAVAYIKREDVKRRELILPDSGPERCESQVDT